MRKGFIIWLALSTIPIVFASTVLAEPVCVNRSFGLVSTADAVALDPSIASVDVNADGYVCRSETTSSDGTVTVEFMDDVDSASRNFVCPPGFVTLNGLAPIDRNGNGLVCQKYVNCDMMSKNCKVVVIDDHPAPP
jgi:hypothetical protein